MYRNLQLPRLIFPIYQFRCKTTIDYSKVPVLKEEDLEEQFVLGSGPGGQAVNKTANNVVLKHLPTGLVVKCHKSRSLQDNRKEARKILIAKLDDDLNGEESVANQLKVIERKKLQTNERKRQKLEDMKKKWKERENVQ